METLAKQVIEGDRRAIARALTVVEDRGAPSRELIRHLWPATGRAVRIGVTGPPGVGKSSLVDHLAERVRGSHGPVGVVAVDPSSAFSQGALLGDRIRMSRCAGLEDVFIRSMANRGHVGGLAPATSEAADVLDAAGFGCVFLETVGVGQSEIEVAFLADITLVVLSPGAGDAVQALKAGVMEIADLFCVNKGDLEGAEAVKADVEGALELATRKDAGPAPVVVASTVTEDGLDDVVRILGEHLDRRDPQRLQDRRRHVMGRRLENELARHLHGVASRRMGEQEGILDAMVQREKSVFEALDEILGSMGLESDA